MEYLARQGCTTSSRYIRSAPCNIRLLTQTYARVSGCEVDMTISQAMALRIKELLREKNMTQYRLEHRACLSHDTVKSIMKGKAKGVNLRTVIALADGFEMTVWEFLHSELFLYDSLDI